MPWQPSGFCGSAFLALAQLYDAVFHARHPIRKWEDRWPHALDLPFVPLA
jgi:hypothetical protein